MFTNVNLMRRNIVKKVSKSWTKSEKINKTKRTKTKYENILFVPVLRQIPPLKIRLDQMKALLLCNWLPIDQSIQAANQILERRFTQNG